MEFLRFGSSIPGSYWGCCAFCIIQNFKFDPSAKASIQLVNGDGGYVMRNHKNEDLFAGPTYEDIFWQRLRYGTFGIDDMPNHGFLAVLTQGQLSGGYGKKWLAILKKAGFEFIRTVDNSVYSGQATFESPEYDEDEDEDEDNEGEAVLGQSRNKNYLFGLFRNVGQRYVEDPFTPPPEWTNLPSVVPELWERLSNGDMTVYAEEQRKAQLPLYEALPKNAHLTEKELEKQGVPVILAGMRSENPQELKKFREEREKENGKTKSPPKSSPWSIATAVPV